MENIYLILAKMVEDLNKLKLRDGSGGDECEAWRDAVTSLATNQGPAPEDAKLISDGEDYEEE